MTTAIPMTISITCWAQTGYASSAELL